MTAHPLPTLAMWMAMTGVMMGPIVLPWLYAVRTMSGNPAHPRASGRSMAVAPFAVGYAAAWVGFCLGAASLQLLLATAGHPVPLTRSAPGWAGAALIAVGAFQFSGMKQACLSHCRSPFGYLLSHWRPGTRGAMRMGWTHGLFCLGCCWALMALALVVGAMSLVWMGLLMGVMLLETLSPGGIRLVKPIGGILIATGLVMLFI